MKMSKATKYFNIQLKTNPVSQITKGYPIMNYLPLLIISPKNTIDLDPIS